MSSTIEINFDPESAIISDDEAILNLGNSVILRVRVPKWVTDIHGAKLTLSFLTSGEPNAKSKTTSIK